jgi:hypothetical protein
LAVAEFRAGGAIGNVSAALLMGARESSVPAPAVEEFATHGDSTRPPVQAVARIARLLDGCFSELLLVGGAPPHPLPGRAIADIALPAAVACPLRGIVSALQASSCERVLVVACDLVAVPVELVLALTALPERDAVVPRSVGIPQSLCAIYRRREVLEIASARLVAGKLALRGLLEAVDCGYLEGADLAAVDPAGAAFGYANRGNANGGNANGPRPGGSRSRP